MVYELIEALLFCENVSYRRTFISEECELSEVAKLQTLRQQNCRP